MVMKRSLDCRLATAVLILMAPGGCSQPEEGGSFTEVDSAGVVVATSVRPVWGDASPWIVGPEARVRFSEDHAGSDIPYVRVRDMVRLPDGRIAAADEGTSEIHLFNERGDHVESLGRQGDGPGDFRALRSLHPVADSLAAFDFSLGRLTIFDEKLEVARTVSLQGPLRVREVLPLEDGSMLLVYVNPTLLHYDGSGNELVRGSVPLVRVSERGTVLDTITNVRAYEEFVFSNDLMGWGAGPAIFGRDMQVAGGGGRIVTGEADEMEYEVFEASGALVRRVRVSPYDLTLSEQEISGEVSTFIASASSAERAREWEEYFADYPMPTTRPAYDDLILDPSGFVWARRHQSQAERDSTQQWEVFDPEGRWMGRISMPPRFRVMEIGDDYVLGVRVDAMDVEHPEMLSLERNPLER